jgi:Ser/Thr protein kinase RdoA (MazF antagonist)
MLVAYGFIDFDLARPATRLLDIIQTLRHWAPLNDPADRDPALRDADAAARVALFCDAYGLDADRRARLTAVARTVIRASHGNMAERARTLGGGWARMWAEGVGDKILRSATWLERNQQHIEARLR